MSTYPTYDKSNGVGCTSDDDNIKVGVGAGGLHIEYDLLTPTPKTFNLNHLGIHWTDGTATYETALGKLSAVQEAFQAVELPPNATTLQINDNIKVTDGTNKNVTISKDVINITDSAGIQLVYTPQITIKSPATNTPNAIPPSTQNPHYVLLQGTPVPQSSLLINFSPTFPEVSDIIASIYYNGLYYVSTQSGSVWYWDGGTWTQTLTFNAPVRTFSIDQFNNLWMGGDFTYCYTNGTSLNYICWISSSGSQYLTSPVWNNQGGNGFSAPVYKIIADGSWMYVGGQFNGIGYGTYQLNKFGIIDTNGLNLYAINDQGGSGFDGDVYDIAYCNSYVVVTGAFTTLNWQTGSFSSNYAIILNFNAYYLSSYDNIGGSASFITSPLSFYSVASDFNSYFTIGGNSIYNGYINYAVQFPYYSPSAVSPVGNNNFQAPIKQVVFSQSTGQYYFLDVNNTYYNQNTNTVITLPFNCNYMFYFLNINFICYFESGTQNIKYFGGSNTNFF